MSATMVGQRGRVQQEQSNKCLALNMGKMAKGGFSHAAIKETQQLIKEPRAEVQQENKQGVEFPGHERVKAAIQRQPAMVYTHHTDGCLPCQNGTAMNLQTRWRWIRSGAPPREPAAPPHGALPPPVKPPPPRTPHPPRTPPTPSTPPLTARPPPHWLPPPHGTPPPPWMPPAPPGESVGTQSYEIQGMPSRWVYIHSPLPNTRFFNHNAYAKDSRHDKDVIPDWLSTLSAAWQYHLHRFSRWEQPFERVWEWRPALIERNGIFEYYCYLQWVDTLKYILKNIFICTIKAQCSDKGKRTWRG